MTRRSWLVSLAAASLGRGVIPAAAPLEEVVLNSKHREMLVHSRRPMDLETPISLLDAWMTPTDHFYLRSHFYLPSIDPFAWRCRAEGLVERPFSLTIPDLKGFESVELPVTMECAGNGRGLFRPRVLGTPWKQGAVGNARWRGVRLRDVLHKAGLKPAARHVAFDGADFQIGKAADFIRSLPLDKCLHPDTLLVHEMNGRPLPIEHGFPLRLMAPGWEGAACVKWLTGIRAQETEFKGPFMQRAYRVPVRPVAPGASVDPKDTKVITSLNVKSLITRPLPGAPVANRPVEIRGFAWAGENRVAGVEVSTDDGRSWQPAELGVQGLPYAWREFRYAWTPPGAGRHVVMARATDSAGRTQPMTPDWNPDGYLNNAIERRVVGVPVEQRRILTALPEGKGKKVYERYCTACHDASPLFRQRHDAAAWRREIEKMEGWAAALPEPDKEILVQYLAEHFQ